MWKRNQGIGVRNSVKKFFQDINQEIDEEKISLIKTLPIQNERESIKEFIALAISNFVCHWCSITYLWI